MFLAVLRNMGKAFGLVAVSPSCGDTAPHWPPAPTCCLRSLSNVSSSRCLSLERRSLCSLSSSMRSPSACGAGEGRQCLCQQVNSCSHCRRAIVVKPLQLHAECKPAPSMVNPAPCTSNQHRAQESYQDTTKARHRRGRNWPQQGFHNQDVCQMCCMCYKMLAQHSRVSESSSKQMAERHTPAAPTCLR